jgi:hypothetical protein
MTRFTKVDAAAMLQHEKTTALAGQGIVPFTAAGFCVNVVSVVAASYFTAWDEALRRSKMQRM